MKIEVLLPLLVTLSVASILLESQTAKAQSLLPVARQTHPSAGNSVLKMRPLPALSIRNANEPGAKIYWDANELRSVADSLEIDRRGSTRKQSDSQPEFFKLPGLPSSVKVPIERF